MSGDRLPTTSVWYYANPLSVHTPPYIPLSSAGLPQLRLDTLSPSKQMRRRAGGDMMTGHCGSGIVRSELQRRPRMSPYPSTAAQKSSRATKIPYHTTAPRVDAQMRTFRSSFTGEEALTCRGYTTTASRAQKRMPPVRLYEGDDYHAGSGAGEPDRDFANADEDHPYIPEHGDATEKYLRCIIWRRNIPDYCPPP